MPKQRRKDWKTVGVGAGRTTRACQAQADAIDRYVDLLRPAITAEVRAAGFLMADATKVLAVVTALREACERRGLLDESQGAQSEAE